MVFNGDINQVDNDVNNDVNNDDYNNINGDYNDVIMMLWCY